MRVIEFYRNDQEESPIDEFFDSLNAKIVQKIAWTLKIVRELMIVPVNYLKKLDGTNDLWEIRVNAGNTKVRLLCFCFQRKIIILTNGFIKKTKKIPKAEIELAHKRKKDYERRYSHER